MTAILKHSPKKKKFLMFFKSGVSWNEPNCIHPQCQHVDISRHRKNCLFSKWLPCASCRRDGKKPGGDVRLWELFDLGFFWYFPGERPWRGGRCLPQPSNKWEKPVPWN